jgi:hypothetical protein
MDIKYISSCHRQISINMVRLLPATRKDVTLHLRCGASAVRLNNTKYHYFMIRKPQSRFPRVLPSD